VHAIQVTTNCVPSASAVPAAEFRVGGVVGPSWFLRAAGDFPHAELQATSHTTPANSQEVTLGDVVPAVCCSSCVVWRLGFGAIPNAKTQRFGIWGVLVGSSQHHLQ
jgi:hypothetical protein